MSKAQFVARLKALDRALDGFGKAACRESPWASGRTVACLFKQIPDLMDCEDLVTEYHGPEWGRHLGDRLHHVYDASRREDKAGGKGSPYNLLFVGVIDRARLAIAHILKLPMQKTAKVRGPKRTLKRGKPKELTKRQNAVVELHEIQNQSLVAIARLWHKSPQSVQQLYDRAKNNPGYKKHRSVNLHNAEPIHANTRRKSDRTDDK